MRDGGEVVFDVALGFFLDFCVFGDEVESLALLEYSHAHLLAVAFIELASALPFHLDHLADLHLLIRDFVVKDAHELGCIFVTLLNSLVVRRTLVEFLFQLENLHFETDNVVILVSEHFLDSGHVDVWLFSETVGLALIEVP